MKLCLKNVAQAGLLSMAIGLAACSGSSTDSSSTNSGLIISGTLGGASLMSLNQKMVSKASENGAYDVNTDAINYEDLEIVATAATEPPTEAAASVNADGSFSVDLGANAAGTAVTVVFKNKESKSVVGEVKFTDSSTTDLNGNPKADSAVVAKSNLTLGTINLSSDGTISIPKNAVANIENAQAISASSAFDPTGEWSMAAYDGSLSSGFETVTSSCDDGPCVGMLVTLARFAGKDFTPNSGSCEKDASGTIASCPVTSGTVGTNDRFALSIWGGDYSESFGACGGTTGFSADEARGYGRIHIASGTLPTIGASGTIAFGSYVFSTPAGFGGTGVAPYNQPWMPSVSATAMHDQHDCRPLVISGTTKLYNAWACRSKVYTGMWPGTAVSTGTQIGWNVGVQGSGCIDTITQKPINVTNWSSIGMPDSYQPPVSATAVGAGFMTHENTYSNVDPDGSGSATTTTIKCTHTGGQFADAGGSPNMSSSLSLPDGQYLGMPETIITQGNACSSAGSGSDAAILAGYRCYANAYWMQGGGQGGGGCSRQYNFNWQATTPADFIRRDDFKGRPQNAFITNILNYSADGQSATLEDEETESVTIPTSANGSTFCKVVRKTQLLFKKSSATKMKVELRESGRMASSDAACIAAANEAMTNQQSELNWMLRSKNYVFYLNKVQ